MDSGANAAILDRTESERAVAEHYGPQVALLAQLVDYGTHLILRAYQSTDRSLAPAIVCNVLLKHVVMMLDGVHIAARAGACPVAVLPARGALEASLSMQWMLTENSDYRARCFLVRDYRREISSASRLIPGTTAYNEWGEQCKRMGVGRTEVSEEELTKIKADANRREAHLARETLASINAEYERRRGGRRRDVDWWELNGASSLADLAMKLGRLTEYEAFYQAGSGAMHLSSHSPHFSVVQQGIAALKPLRHLEGMHDLVTSSMSTAMCTYRAVLRHYRPEESALLESKYEKEWRKPFFSTRTATYPQWDRRTGDGDE